MDVYSIIIHWVGALLSHSAMFLWAMDRLNWIFNNPWVIQGPPHYHKTP